MRPQEPLLDHLVYATPDLESTCRDLELLLGVSASAGGQHPGRGTHNALISIGSKAYLEIIGPDPKQAGTTVWFGIDKLTTPKLLTWAVRVNNLEAFVKDISPRAKVGTVRSGSRLTPTGASVSWQLTEPQLEAGSGPIPFLIEWNTPQHPADSAIGGPRLVQFRIEHPEPELMRKELKRLRLEVAVEQSTTCALVAVFERAKDLVELR